MSASTHMFLERSFDPPLTVERMLEDARGSAWCFDLYRVTWHSSFLASGGGRMLCWFSAADAESTRMALRRASIDTRVLWAGTVHEASETVAPNVLVEREFDEPVDIEQIQAMEDAAAWCFSHHRVRFAFTFFSRDRKRMRCLYAAPDAEAVRVAQREAGMPFTAVWPFQIISPEVSQRG